MAGTIFDDIGAVGKGISSITSALFGDSSEQSTSGGNINKNVHDSGQTSQTTTETGMQVGGTQGVTNTQNTQNSYSANESNSATESASGQVATGTQKGNNVTSNSGSTNISAGTQGPSTTTQGPSSINTSGSAVTTGPSQSTTGPTNTTSNQSQTGSNTTQTSGTTNVSKTSGSQDTTGAAASVNTSTVGPSSSTQYNSGSVDVAQTILSTDATNRIAQTLLEGKSGLAATVSGANAAGGYNSTTRSLLASDLLARIAGEVAVRGAATVTTRGPSSSTVSNSGSTTTQNVGATSGFVNRGGSFTEQILGGTTATSSQNLSTIGDVANSGNTTTNSGNTTFNSGNTVSNSGNIVSNSGFSTSGTNVIGGSTSSVVSELLNTSEQLTKAASDTSGLSRTSNNAINSTNVDSKIVNYQNPSTTTATTKTGPRDVTEISSTTPVVTKKESGGLFDELGWIICSELHAQGRMPHRMYLKGGAHFARYPDWIKQGYYIWAEPATKHLRKHPESLFSRALEIIFTARGNYLLGSRSISACVAASGVYAFCWMLAKTIARDHKFSLTKFKKSLEA